VCLIDYEGRAVLCCKRSEVREGSDVSVHAEEGFSHEDLSAGHGREGAQSSFGGGDVDVFVVGLAGAGEAASVDDTGMVGVVGDHEVTRSSQGGDYAKVGVVPRREKEHCLGIEIFCQGGLKFPMFWQVAGDQAGGACAKTGTCNGIDGSRCEVGVTCEP
jgi:hypothetical protein